MGSDLFGDFRRRATTPTCVRRLRDAGFVIVGKTTLPEMGILPTTESRRFGPDAQPVGHSTARPAARAVARRRPSPPAWCRSPTATTAAARPGSPPPCCGLVGLKPARAGVSRSGPTSARASWSPTACSRAPSPRPPPLLDVLAGYEPGDATWAPPPPAPFAELRRARDAGSLRDRARARRRRSRVPRSTRCARPRRATPRRCSSRSATRCRRSPRRGPDLDLLSDFTRAFGPSVVGDRR